MNKVLIFGLLGAFGCLIGWAVGEGLLAATLSSSKNEQSTAPSLVTRPEAPKIDALAPAKAPAPPAPKLEAKGPPPTSSPEFSVRRQRRQGEVGDITLSLNWSNTNDLDLHCVDPAGDVICWFTRNASKSDGFLDVDSNGPEEDDNGKKIPLTNEPCENIRYKKGPPLGRYRVLVQMFNRRVGGTTNYRWEILLPDTRFEDSGSFSVGASADRSLEESLLPAYQKIEAIIQEKSPENRILGKNRPMRLIKEFYLPGLRIAAPAAIVLFPGQSNKMTVRLERDPRNREPVTLSFSGDASSFARGSTTIAGDQSDAEIELMTGTNETAGRRQLRIVAEGKYGRVETSCTVDVQVPPPTLVLAAPKEVPLGAGGATRMAVRIVRANFPGPVSVSAGTAPSGVRISEATIPEGKDEAEIELTADANATAGGRGISLKASGKTANGEPVAADANFDLNVVRSAAAPSWSWSMVLLIGAWTALLAVGLSLALVIGQNRFTARPWLTSKQASALLIGGGLAGFAAGSIGQTLFGLLARAEVLPQIGFLFGWLLLGGLLGRGVGFFIPNLHVWRACAAGVVGGLLGALGFILISRMGDMAGRLVGAGLLGFCIGLMVALVEVAFRAAWLEVRFGPGEVIAVNLGPEPVRVGGDGKSCTVWARGAAPVAMRFWLRNGKVVCEDVVAGRTDEVANGDIRKVAKLELVVRTGAGRAPARPSAPPPLPSGGPPPLPKSVPPPLPPSGQAAPPLPSSAPSPPPAPVKPPPPPVRTQQAPPPAKPATVQVKPPPPPPKPSAAPVRPSAPAPTGKAAADSLCPGCGRKVPGEPGRRYCLVCDHSF